MSEPVRFLGSGGLKAKLLASAKEDRPPKGSRRRSILAAAAAAAASTKAASATATLSAATLGRWALWKWIAVGALGAGTVVAAKSVILSPPPTEATSPIARSLVATVPVAHARRSSALASPPDRDSTALASSLEPQPPLPARPTDLTRTARVDDARGVAAVTAPIAPGRHSAPTLPPAAPHPEARIVRPQVTGVAARADDSSGLSQGSSLTASTLFAEIAAIDRVKRALASGDAAEALRRADAYGAAFPAGTLSAEATALRIEALARSGRLGDARAELARLRADHPDNPLLENLTRIVGE